MGMKCTGCGKVINEPVLTPCPHCGHTGRTVEAVGTATISVRTGAKLDGLRSWALLLDTAEALLNAGDPSTAVIVAQTACEVIAGRLLGKSYNAKHGKKGIPWLSLHKKKVLKNYKQRTKDKNIDKEPFWPDYVEMVKHRNNSVHGGYVIRQSEGKKGVDAARKLVEHVARHNGL